MNTKYLTVDEIKKSNKRKVVAKNISYDPVRDSFYVHMAHGMLDGKQIRNSITCGSMEEAKKILDKFNNENKLINLERKLKNKLEKRQINNKKHYENILNKSSGCCREALEVLGSLLMFD